MIGNFCCEDNLISLVFCDLLTLTIIHANSFNKISIASTLTIGQECGVCTFYDYLPLV